MKYLILVSITLCLPLLAYAEFKPFQTLPGLQNAGNLTTQQYIDALYVIAIAAASILAVLKLIWAGVQYMLSEVVTNKQKARDDIKGALLGLLIILAAVTILNTVNPNLTKIDFLRNAKIVEPVTSSGTNGGGSSTNSGSGSSQNSWQETVTGMNQEGDSPAIQASDLSDKCRREGGDPVTQNRGNNSVLVICNK